MEAFRFEQNIPHPKQGNPRFREDVRGALGRRRLLLRKRRREIEAVIVKLLGENPGSGVTELKKNIGCSEMTVRFILDKLLSERRIAFKWLGRKRCYHLLEWS